MTERRPNIVLEHPVSGVGGWRVIPELSDDELRFIGLVTTQWANLEHAIFEATLSIADQLGISPSTDVENISFDKRLRAFRDLATSAPKESAAHIIHVSDRISNLKDDRHKITHGLWDWDRENPEKLTASSFRPRYGFEKPFDKQKLEKLADRIGECIFSIMFPNGLSVEDIASYNPRPIGTPIPASELNLPNDGYGADHG